MDKIINDKESYYLPNRGVNNFNTQVYNEYLHESFKQIFERLALQDTTVLIKASRGMALERVLDLL